MSEYKGRKDNEVYAELEQRYLENRDKNAFWGMYLLVQRFEKRFIRKYCRVKNCRFGATNEEHEQEIEDLANDMTVWMMNRYIKDPTFKCKEGMSAYAPWAFKKIMYDPNKIAREKMKKELDETQVLYEHIEVIEDFETESEKRERYHKEKVAPGVYQGILPIFGEENEE